MATLRTCGVAGCERPLHGRGLCALHYARQHPEGHAFYETAPLAERDPAMWRALTSRPRLTRHLGACREHDCPECARAADWLCGLVAEGVTG